MTRGRSLHGPGKRERSRTILEVTRARGGGHKESNICMYFLSRFFFRFFPKRPGTTDRI